MTRLLSGVRADLSVLRELAVEIDERGSEPTLLDAVKYRFVTVIGGDAA